MALATKFYPGDREPQILAKLLILFGGTPTAGDGRSELLHQILNQVNNVNDSVVSTPGDTGYTFDFTWNAGSTAFDGGLIVDVDNQASASNSFLANFMLDSTSVLTLRKDGRLSLTGRVAATTTSSLGHSFSQSTTGTNNTPLVLSLQHGTSATPVAGFGLSVDVNLDSATVENTRATRWTWEWTDVTHASRSAKTTFYAYVSGTETAQMVLGGNMIQGNPGSPTVPSFSNRNGATTGIYFPGDTTVGVSTEGNLRGTFNSSGLNLASGHTLLVNGTQVVSSRATGWAAATGTPTRTTFVTSTVTTAELAERVKALIDDLITHGLIGA